MKTSSSAFTLLETIVALAVFSIVVIGCVAALEGIGNIVSDLRAEALARRGLENRALELRGQNQLASPSSIVSGRASDISISEQQEPVSDEEAGIPQTSGLTQIRMVASWKSPRGGVNTLTNTILVRRTN